MTTPTKMELGACWKCAVCGWVGCYSASDLKEYGAPSECNEDYHEALYEIDLAEGWAVLADQAVVAVRVAARELEAAKVHSAEVERTRALAAQEDHHDQG